MFKELYQSIVRTSAFIRKEIIQVVRQPRLLFTLILGPFLILLIFGIGYRNQARVLRTLFVAPENSSIRKQIEEYATTLGEQLDYRGTVSDENQALAMLRRGQVDVVIIAPKDAENTIRNNHQAVFTLYHHEIDPFQADYVRYFGQVYIDEVNRRVLMSMTQQGQKDASTVKQDVSEAKQNAATLKQALQTGDQATARQQKTELSNNLGQVSLAVGATVGVLSGVSQTSGGGPSEDTQAILSALTDAQQNADQVNVDNASQGGNQAEIDRVSKVEQDLDNLDSRLGEFTSLDPAVLVRPFASEAKSIAPTQPTPTTFFAPAVIALLLQHLAVTLGALSIVRERSVGTTELFRVSPLTAGETLTGKYISYMIFGGVLTLVLTLLLVYVLKIPMLGNWWNYALVIAALLFTSLGFGFVISLVSQTDTQAVQYTMILLLTSVFFSGFLMSLDTIIREVRVLSWMLPTTYGIVLLRDIFLRGVAPNLLLVGGLFGIGLVLMLLSWVLMRRLISPR